MRWLLLLFALAGCDRECGARTANVKLHVLDAATRAPVDQPSFTFDGTLLQGPPFCATSDLGPCDPWALYMVGKHDIGVSAPGYAPQIHTLDAGARDDTCGPTYERRLEETFLLIHQ